MVLGLAACTAARFGPVPGALPMPLAMAKAECRSTMRSVEPVAVRVVSDSHQEAVIYRDCIYALGWVRERDDNTVIISTAGLTAEGKYPGDISDDQIYCLLAISRKTGYRPILSHVSDPYTGLYDEAELFTDIVKATPTEAALLAGYGAEADRCTWRMLQEMAQAAPRFSPILERRAKEGKLISIDLINRNITFAEAALRQHASIQKAKNAIMVAAH
jgi:hypothetical protein